MASSQFEGSRVMAKIAAEKVREFRAEAKFQRTSPQKAKLVLDTIKGMRVEQALNTVHFSTKRMAPVIEKVLRSAIQNATYIAQEQGLDVDVDNLYVRTAVSSQLFSTSGMSCAGSVGACWRLDGVAAGAESWAGVGRAKASPNSMTNANLISMIDGTIILCGVFFELTVQRVHADEPAADARCSDVSNLPPFDMAARKIEELVRVSIPDQKPHQPLGFRVKCFHLAIKPCG